MRTVGGYDGKHIASLEALAVALLAYTTHDLLDGLYPSNFMLVVRRCLWEWSHTNIDLALAQLVPYLLGHEGHERVQHIDEIAKNGCGSVTYLLRNRLRFAVEVSRLDHFQKPGAEVTPNEAIQFGQGVIESERLVIGLDVF